MVCAKCQKLQKQTKLATPDVKKKSEMYYGSSAGTRSTGGGSKAGATLGSSGVTKNKLLSKSAKNPYAAYASSCTSCPAKTEAGYKFCSKCSYQKHCCPMCGKSMTAQSSSGSNVPVVQGQKRTLK